RPVVASRGNWTVRRAGFAAGAARLVGGHRVGGNRQSDAELRAARPRLDYDVAVVAANQLSRDVQTEAGSLPDRFAGHERIEDAIADVVRNAAAVVLDANHDEVELTGGGHDH